MNENSSINKKIIGDNVSFALYFIAGVLFSIAFLSTNLEGLFSGEWTHWSLWLEYVFFLLILLASLLWNISGNDQQHDSYTKQLFVFFLFFSIFWDVNFIYTENDLIVRKMAFAGLISLNSSMFLMLFGLLEGNRGRRQGVMNVLRKHSGIVVILFVYAILSIQNFGVWFKVDSYSYYNSVVENLNTWDFTLNTLSSFEMGGHISYIYSMILTIGQYIWPASGNGVQLINLILSEIMIALFYAICVQLFRDRLGKIEISLLSAVFAFAPLMFGISYLVSTDFPLMFFFVLLVFACIYEQRITFLFAALGICFSKETGIILLAAFLFGKLVSDVAQAREKKKLWSVIGTYFRRDITIIYPAVFLFLVTILFGNSGWVTNLKEMLLSGNLQETSDLLENQVTKWHYYIYKIEEMCLINYMWLVSLVIAIAIVCCVVRRVRRKKIQPVTDGFFETHRNIIIPLMISYACFIAINFLYFAYVHYRYVQLILFFNIIFLGIALCQISLHIYLRRTLLLIIGLLFFASSYINFDPVTYVLLPQFNAGNGTMVSTRRYFYAGTPYGFGYTDDEEYLYNMYLSVGLEYNRQQIQLQYALEKMFEEINYDSTKLVVFRNFGGWIESTCWQLFGLLSYDCYYWDSESGTVILEDNENPINIAIPGSETSFDSYSEVYYVDFPFNEHITDSFLEENIVIDESDVSCGVWKFTVYRIK